MDKNERRRKLITVVGLNGAGKTRVILEMIDKYQDGKVLIYDRQQEAEYMKFAEIPVAGIPHMKSGKYKVRGSEWEEILTTLNSTPYEEGLIVLEDSSSYLPKHENKALMDMFVSRRHRGIDIVLTFHSINRIPPYVLENMDTLILFKTNDNPQAHIKQSVPRPDLMLRFYDQVEKHSWQYFHMVINVRDLQPVA